ncbi:hypothetical protein M5K25_023913 [Dendrobium thyrsiflorum]|uniref:Uncharacterized protein n=1 Tax=Dendrobium thyrsiflorum TaxID=117978 RepID=A0ABD0U0P0_DENTH
MSQGFDAIGEHTGAGHSRNIVVPFGGKSPGISYRLRWGFGTVARWRGGGTVVLVRALLWSDLRPCERNREEEHEREGEIGRSGLQGGKKHTRESADVVGSSREFRSLRILMSESELRSRGQQLGQLGFKMQKKKKS